jgi:hypothetical protein
VWDYGGGWPTARPVAEGWRPFHGCTPRAREPRLRDERDIVNTTIDLTTRLEALRDEYTYRLNLLLDEGREDLAAKLSDEYLEAAARVLAE